MCISWRQNKPADGFDDILISYAAKGHECVLFCLHHGLTAAAVLNPLGSLYVDANCMYHHAV